MADPLLKGNEIDKALAAGFASVSEAFAAKLRSNEVPEAFAKNQSISDEASINQSTKNLPLGPLRALGLDATSYELGKLCDELLSGARRLRRSTWATVSQDGKLQDFQRAAGAERGKGIRLINEQKNRVPNHGADFLKKQHVDTQQKLKVVKEAPSLIEAKKTQLQEERGKFIAETKRVLACHKAANQWKRKLTAQQVKLIAMHQPGGLKEQQRAETEGALRESIERFPQFRLNEFERVRKEHAAEIQRLADGWAIEKLGLQNDIVSVYEERERWMMQGEDLRHLLVQSTEAHKPQDDPDLVQLVHLIKMALKWKQEKEEEDARIAQLRAKLEKRSSFEGSKRASAFRKESIQTLKEEIKVAQQAHKKRRSSIELMRRESLKEQTRRRSLMEEVRRESLPSIEETSASCPAGLIRIAKHDAGLLDLIAETPHTDLQDSPEDKSDTGRADSSVDRPDTESRQSRANSVSSLNSAEERPDKSFQDKLYVDLRQALVQNGVEFYLQSNELQQIFQDNRQLEQEYQDLQRKKEEAQAFVRKGLQDVIDEPGRLFARWQQVVKEVDGLKERLDKVQSQLSQALDVAKTGALLYATKLYCLYSAMDKEERVFGAFAAGKMISDNQRAEEAIHWTGVFEKREPELEKSIQPHGQLADKLEREFDEVHARTMIPVNRLVRFFDRGHVTLCLQAADQHIMNVEQHAAIRDTFTERTISF